MHILFPAEFHVACICGYNEDTQSMEESTQKAEQHASAYKPAFIIKFELYE